MEASKTFFEQIPIETVKRIAKEFPDKSESWRELAQKIQDEPDPNRVSELVEQLIVTLDQEELRKRRPPKRNAGTSSE